MPLKAGASPFCMKKRFRFLNMLLTQMPVEYPDHLGNLFTLEIETHWRVTDHDCRSEEFYEIGDLERSSDCALVFKSGIWV